MHVHKNQYPDKTSDSINSTQNTDELELVIQKHKGITQNLVTLRSGMQDTRDSEDINYTINATHGGSMAVGLLH